MPKIIFKPSHLSIDVPPDTKLLRAGIKSGAPIRYGCASCKCGTCGVKVFCSQESELSVMDADEKELLARMNLDTGGRIRLACRAKIISGNCEVDLDFQDTYSPDDVG